MISLNDLRPTPSMEAVLRELKRGSIVVKGPDADGKYTILYGTRTYLATECQSANPATQEIPCIFLGDNIDETREALFAEMDLLQIQGESTIDTSEMERRRLKVCNLLCRLSAQGGIAHKSIVPLFCEIFRCTTRYARIYIKICEDGIPEMQDALISSLTPANRSKAQNGMIQVHVPAGTLAALCVLPAKLQRKALQRINNGEPAGKVKREMLAEYRQD